MSKLKNVIQTLFHLESMIKFQVDTLNRIFDNDQILNQIKHKGRFENKITFRDSLNTLLSNYSIIPFCSFLEEYNKFFTASFIGEEYSDRIRYVKELNKPGMKRINQWKDLRDFRNVMVAHNFRKNAKSYFSSEFENYEYIIPNTNSEKNLFYGIIHIMCLNIRDEFLEIIMTIDSDYLMIDQLKIIGEKVETKNELNKLLKKMR